MVPIHKAFSFNSGNVKNYNLKVNNNRLIIMHANGLLSNFLSNFIS